MEHLFARIAFVGTILTLTAPFASGSTTAPPSLSISSGQVHEAHCGQANGAIETYAIGGTPPYNYLWSPEPPNGQGTQQIYGLAAGDWTLTVTDNDGTQVSQVFTVTNNPDLLGTEFQYPAQDSHANCPGQCWGEFRVPESYLPGQAPYQYSEPIQGYDVLGEPYFYVPGGACGGEYYQITITDNTGCSGVMDIVIVEPQAGQPLMSITNISGSCTGGNGGSVAFEHVYDGGFFTAPALTIYDMQDNYITGQQGVGQTATFTGLAPGQYYARRDWNWSYQYTAQPCDDATAPFTIPDLGVACGTVSGDVFIDNDQDCAQDGGEVGVPELVLEIQPGGTYVITDTYGHYSVDLGDGGYTLAQNDASLVQLCPVAVPVPFAMASNAQIIDLADSSTVPLDLQPWIASGAAHPGFAFQYVLKVRNNTPQVSGDVFLTLDFDASVLTYTSASQLPTSVVGDVIVWDLPPMTAYAQTTISVDFLLAVATPLGTPISANLHVTNTLPEGDVTNNVATTSTIAAGSYDPNEKVVATSTGLYPDVFVIGDDQWLDYTIRFQNTGTAEALTVVVTDTLDADLDMGSFQQGAASHAYTVSFKPERVVEWRFDNINLPDSGTSEVESHGLLQFRIRPVQPLLAGTVFSNAADIYFDFNDPIHTNGTVITAEMTTGMQGQGRGHGLLVFPDPATSTLRIDLPADAARLRILSSDGRQVLVRTDLRGAATLSVERLPSGAYTVEVLTPNGDLQRTRFIKQ